MQRFQRGPSRPGQPAHYRAGDNNLKGRLSAALAFWRVSAHLRSSGQLPTFWRIFIWWAQVLVVIAALWFCCSTFMRPPGYNAFYDSWLYLVVPFGAAILCLLRGMLIHDREQLGWLAFGAGLLAWASGAAYSAIWLAPLAVEPKVSNADIGYIAFYPLTYIGVISIMRGRMQQAPRSLWLDGVVGGLAATSVASAFLSKAVLFDMHGNDFELLIKLAYPIGDMSFLALVVGCFSLSVWKPDRSWIVMAIGLLLFAFADASYLYLSTRGPVEGGTPLHNLWTLGLALLGLAPWRTARRFSSNVFEQRSIVVMPLFFASVAIGVLVVDHVQRVHTLAVTLAVGALFCGLVRLLITFDEVRSLGESRRQARTDELTELGNRRLFYERTNTLMRDRNDDNPLAMLLIDLDHFKEVNDTLGHQFGDNLLRQVGPRLREVVRDEDAISRLGGDEFAVILDGATHEFAIGAAERIRAALEKPFSLDGVPVRISGSIGIALFPEHAREPHGLLQHADVAMYAAKLSGSGHKVYVPEQDEHTRERLRTIDELRTTLEQRRIVVHYQPKVNAATGELAGAEALVRLSHSTRGLIPPGEFLPLAEQAGLMKMLTSHVLDIVLDDIHKWRNQGRFVKIAINLSITNLIDVEFPASVSHGLAKRGLFGESLVFEITESTILSEPERARSAIAALHQLGAKVSLDDYGTGYASLAYLRQLELDELKLDRSFVSSLDDPVSRVFVSSAVDLAHALGLSVVSEGIETQEMWAGVRDLGSDVCQGYYFSRPLPSDAFLEYIKASTSFHLPTSAS